MRFCLLVSFVARAHNSGRPCEYDLRSIEALVAEVPGLSDAFVHTPAEARDPFLAGDTPPSLVLQLGFSEVPALEAAMSQTSPLVSISETLDGCEIRQQAMALRSFPVPEPPPSNGSSCSYLVAYHGVAEDSDAWIGHYLSSHAPLMAKLPGIRAIEVMTRLDAVCELPWTRENALLRNRVMFDSPDALTAALASPVRAEMRADYQSFPSFRGTVTHYPMITSVMA